MTTGYSVPADQVPDDGRPYVADWCPTEQAVRPFSIEVVDGEGEYLACLCGYVREYEGTDSPGTSPEPEADEDDELTDDAATWHADPAAASDDLADEQVGVAWCDECGCERTFVVLPDEEVEGDPDPDWVYWACVMCRCGPGGDVRSVMDPPADAGWSEPQTVPYFRVTRTGTRGRR